MNSPVSNSVQAIRHPELICAVLLAGGVWVGVIFSMNLGVPDEGVN